MIVNNIFLLRLNLNIPLGNKTLHYNYKNYVLRKESFSYKLHTVIVFNDR